MLLNKNVREIVRCDAATPTIKPNLSNGAVYPVISSSDIAIASQRMLFTRLVPETCLHQQQKYREIE